MPKPFVLPSPRPSPGPRYVSLPPRSRWIAAEKSWPTPIDVATDGANRIFVSNFQGASITVYGAKATGNVAPLRAISGTMTGLNKPGGIEVNGTGAIFVGNNGGNDVLSFAPGANGNVAPATSIGGLNTMLDHPAGLSLH